MDVHYEVRKSMRARAIRIAVHPDARVVITVPRIFSSGTIECFLEKHARWIERALKRMEDKKVLRFSRANIPMLKRRAQVLAEVQSTYFARLYGVQYKKISIRAQKSRWGSCTTQGTLSFNYKIAALPGHMRDYIIVHEVCHLLEPNHSKKFWEHVARTVPEHRHVRQELRDTAIVFC